ncbi:MAG: FixH family protein [Rhodobacteraceae bacterium]|nr:FixH family protein [Paracoccaceae bacterium]
MSERQFTGRHAAIVFVSAFGVIIAANIALAVSAVRTFPGLEVANSYVASQEFDARREAQEALGWRLAAQTGGGLLSLAITDASGAPVKAAELNATVGRPTEMADDFTPGFAFDGTAYVAPAELAPGNWNIRLKARAADGTEFTQRIVLHVDG